LRAQHEADRQREALRAQAEQLEREARQAQALRELRARLQPNDRVYVQRFRANGRVVRADYKRNTVTVSVGLGQWEVPFDDIFPPNPEVRS